jgi:hypothetical protein
MKLVLLVLMLVPALALAQPSGSGSAGSGSGSASSGSGSQAPASTEAPTPPPAPVPADANAAARKACTDAMNADPTFEKMIVDTADRKAAELRLQADQEQHQKAASAVEKNQKHVIMAYAAMWIIAAGFVMFLWRRQQTLRNEIAGLKADLDAATKDGK